MKIRNSQGCVVILNRVSQTERALFGLFVFHEFSFLVNHFKSVLCSFLLMLIDFLGVNILVAN